MPEWGKWAANFMGSDTLSGAAIGGYVARTVVTTVIVVSAVLGVVWLVYDQTIRGFETTFKSLDTSVADIRKDVRHVRDNVQSLDERTADRFVELFARDGAIEVSLTGDIGELTSEIRATNLRLDRLVSEIGSTNKNLSEFREEFRAEMRSQDRFREAVFEGLLKRPSPGSN